MKLTVLILLLTLLNPLQVYATDWVNEASCDYAYLVTETSGTNLADSCGGDDDGTIENGTPTFENSSKPAAYVNNYLDNAGDANIHVPDTYNISTTMSHVLWVDYDGWGNNQAVWYSNNHLWYTDGTPARGFVVFINYDTTDINGIASENTVPAASTWFHLAWTLTGGTFKLYVDGVEVTAWDSGPNAGATNMAFQNDLHIMGESSRRWINGRFTEFAGFSVALSGTDINDIMDSGLSQAGEEEADRRIITISKAY